MFSLQSTILVIAKCILVVVAAYASIILYGVLLTERMFRRWRVPGPGRGTIAFPGGERVRFTAADGWELQGVLFRSTLPTNRYVIFCHEAGADMKSAEEHAWFLPANGFNVFSFNFRDHARVNGQVRARPWLTAAELNDAIGATRFIEGIGGPGAIRIGIMGVSRGACAALCIASAEPSITAAVADGAFDNRATLERYMRKWTKTYLKISRFPDSIYRLQSYLVLKIAEVRMKCRIPSVMAGISKNTKPLLLIHGELDRYVPIDEVLKLCSTGKAGVERQVWIASNAAHNGAARTWPREYQQRVLDFFNRQFGGKADAMADTIYGMAPDGAD